MAAHVWYNISYTVGPQVMLFHYNVDEIIYNYYKINIFQVKKGVGVMMIIKSTIKVIHVQHGKGKGNRLLHKL